MDEAGIIKKTKKFVENELKGEGSGHDWWHVYRVWKNAKLIEKSEKCDYFVVEVAALLHDISDWKFNNGDEEAGAKIAADWLRKNKVDETRIGQVYEIISTSSFKGAKVKSSMRTIEGKIVQDADRLDAIGAVGIGRTFAYGGHMGREMYNPNIKPQIHSTAEQYKNNSSPTINHFYEKLLLLKDLMNTDSAKQIAKERHIFMEEFLERFYKEWKGEA